MIVLFTYFFSEIFSNGSCFWLINFMTTILAFSSVVNSLTIDQTKAIREKRVLGF